MSGADFTVQYDSGKRYISRLKHGEDLLQSIVALCGELSIETGTVQAVGALSSARIAYYDQAGKAYRELSFDGRYEIASLMGNITIRDGAPLCHAHIVLSDEQGRAWGGHLLQGCKIFAAETIITALQGPMLVRGLDDVTGLPLWSRPQPQ